MLLENEIEELYRRNPDVHALLKKIFEQKDGKGDYSVERHKWIETLDKEAFLKK